MSNDLKAGQDIKAGERVSIDPLTGKVVPKKQRADAPPVPERERITQDGGGPTVERTG